ncbi:MAG: desulfoferrodoxin Dfx [Erysipelotrichaceae bacterium]|nr:desulfoferrodoxin Dfx [Erysipelotrichaceae bacterium]
MVRFFKCPVCGKILMEIEKRPCPTMCCGKPMEEMTLNTSDGAFEKHVPVVEQDGNKVTVKVGSVAHPMLAAHYITFIALETNKGLTIRNLNPGEEPKADFILADDEKVIMAYEYCNLHGLWGGN